MGLCTMTWHILRLEEEEEEETASRYGKWMQIYWISSQGQLTWGGPPACRLDGGLTTLHNPHNKKGAWYKMLHRVSNLDAFFGMT